MPNHNLETYVFTLHSGWQPNSARQACRQTRGRAQIKPQHATPGNRIGRRGKEETNYCTHRRPERAAAAVPQSSDPTARRHLSPLPQHRALGPAGQSRSFQKELRTLVKVTFLERTKEERERERGTGEGKGAVDDQDIV
jgi:hypothetical protein